MIRAALWPHGTCFSSRNGERRGSHAEALPGYLFTQSLSFSTDTMCNTAVGFCDDPAKNASVFSLSSFHVPRVCRLTSARPRGCSINVPFGRISNDRLPREGGNLNDTGRKTVSLAVSSSWEWTQCCNNSAGGIFLLTVSVPIFQSSSADLRASPGFAQLAAL
jgi:hypothetical protein